IEHTIKRYVRIGCDDLINRTNIKTMFQNLSGMSIAHIEPNCNKTVDKLILLMDQDNVEISSESLSNDELDETSNTIRAGNLKAEDCYSSEDMHANLEDLATNGELTFEKILSVKTIK
ncbi:25120_t:CDS:2, partial [Gigaspora margarita]